MMQFYHFVLVAEDGQVPNLMDTIGFPFWFLR